MEPLDRRRSADPLRPELCRLVSPTWLAFLVGAVRSLGLVALLHVALAALGAYLLARRLGARPEAASLAALGFAAGGSFVSLVHALGHLSGAAWLPWAMLAADRVATAERGREARRASVALGLVGAAALLNGEPVTLTGLVVGVAFFLFRDRHALRPALGRAVAAALLAATLAGVQLLPAWVRLTESSRAAGLAPARALEWSLPPVRLGELLVPHLLGDPSRVGQGLWFGWGIEDRDFPFVLVLAPGMAVLLLALLGWLRGGIPRRGALAGLALGGAALALGRHLPLLPALRALGPPFSAVRFPEKFFYLTGAALALTAALALERLLAAREAGDPRPARWLERFAVAVLALQSAIAAYLYLGPAKLTSFLATHAGASATPAELARGLAFYRSQALLGLSIAVALTLLAVATRRSRFGSRALATGWIVLAACELVPLARPLVSTLPIAAYLDPPPLARQALATPGRLWSRADDLRLPPLSRPGGGLALPIEAALDRLDPASGVNWGLSYALSRDYAVTYTAPARRAEETARRLARAADPTLFRRFAGAWGVTETIEPRTPAELVRALRSGEARPLPARLDALAETLPPLRMVQEADYFDDSASALAAALDAGLPLARREFLIAPADEYPQRFDTGRTLAVVSDLGDTMDLALGDGNETLLVIATTWDADWSAVSAGEALPVFDTAAGYLAVPVPAGARRVKLRYRDPWVRVGGALSLAALAGLALAASRSRRLAR